MPRRFAFALIILALLPPIAWADFTGWVVGVTDGDTIKVLHNGRAEKIRLYGIDCPEKGQPYGSKAKHLTSSLAFGKEVNVRVVDVDRYGRTVGEVILPDGRNLSSELVAAGLAWWYRRYAPHDIILEGLEGEARAAKRGLWADPDPVPPWCYRKRQKGQVC